MRSLRVNWMRALFAMLFEIGETAYFGWHWGPKSDAEIICDGISILIFALAYDFKSNS